MLILYVIPFMAIAALVIEAAVERDARGRRRTLRQYRAEDGNATKRRGFLRR